MKLLFVKYVGGDFDQLVNEAIALVVGVGRLIVNKTKIKTAHLVIIHPDGSTESRRDVPERGDRIGKHAYFQEIKAEKVSNRNDEVAALTNQVAELNNQFTDLKAQIDSKDRLLADQHEQIIKLTPPQP